MTSIWETQPPEVTVVHRGGLERPARFTGWVGGDKGAGKSVCLLSVTGKSGIRSIVECSLTHGWCKKPADDWRLTDQSHDELLEWARSECRRKIATTPRSTGRKRGRRAPKVHPKQQNLF